MAREDSLIALEQEVAGRCSAVRWAPVSELVRRGEKVRELDLDLGGPALGSPVTGHVVRRDSAPSRAAESVVTDPYGQGWLLELSPAEPAEVRKLVASRDAGERARENLQRYRRRVALHLLIDAEQPGPSLAEGGELPSDPRQMLGGPRYLRLLQELVYWRPGVEIGNPAVERVNSLEAAPDELPGR